MPLTHPCLLLLMATLLLSAAAAQPAATDSAPETLTEAQKIDRLIEHVESLEGAVFIRNGEEHTPAEAADHMRVKRRFAGNRIRTARDFIRGAASESSRSGEPYIIRMADGQEVRSGAYLAMQLERIERGGAAVETEPAATRAARAPLAPGEKLKVAAVVTSYFHNSHADVIVSRLFQTDTLDGKGREYPLELVSLYTDQVHEKDISRGFSQRYGFPIYDSVEEALTLGTGDLAVDAVLLVAEHGNYPKSDTGNTQYPKRRLFEEIVNVFEKTGKVVPVFIDKHISDNWQDMKWMYDKIRELDIPVMAGSSLPVLWRRPPADVRHGAELEQIVAISYHTLDHYGFHALELVQALAERRKGGETGIESVQTLSNEQVWEAFENPPWDPELFEMAMKVLPRNLAGERPLREAVPEPTLFIINYKDGLKAYVFTLNGAVGEWSAAWKYRGDEEPQRVATWYYTQEARPFYHFALLDNAIEQMFLTGEPTYPVERTLLSSGALDALLISKKEGGRVVETPYLEIEYQSDWDWEQPPPPPPDRPIQGQ